MATALHNLSFCFKICVRCGSGLLQHDGAGEDEGGVVAIVGAAVGDVDAVVCCDPGGLDRGRVEVVGRQRKKPSKRHRSLFRD